MKNIITLILLTYLISCGKEKTQKVNSRTHPPSSEEELKQLKKDILHLEGTISMIQAFTAKDFSSCGETLPVFEKKICQIAQTAVAENNLDYFSSLAAMVKVYQDQLYGIDCPNTTAAGCPLTGSIMDNLAALNAASDNYETEITSLQTSVVSLQTNLSAINTRLNNFDGTGKSIEVVVQSINSEVSSLENRIAAIETTVASGDIWKTVKICGDIADSGPLYETVLFSGDRTEIVAFIQTNPNHNGLGVLASTGSGDQYKSTALNTRTCKWKIYDRVTSLKICWMNTDRSASSSSIDLACNAPSFNSPTSACTCK